MKTNRRIRCSETWGPAWLHKKRPEPAAVKCPLPVPEHGKATPPQIDSHDDNEWYWQQIEPRDYRYLTEPRHFPPPCPWCRGRLRHTAECEELQKSWEIRMPFGKHKGRPISEVPPDYLEWLDQNRWLSAELRAAVQQRG